MIHPSQQASLHAPKLSDVLFDQPSRNFATIATIPSNVHAHDAALLFATGSLPLVALVGPSGWGKSHLLDAVATTLSQDTCLPHEVNSAVDWVSGAPRVDSAMPLLLDNVQDALDKPRIKLQLRLALERRVRAGRRTILSFTAPKPTRQIRNLLPYVREWIVATIAAPDATERLYVLQQMCASEGLNLSATLSRVIAARMKGNGRTLAGALKRLRLSGSQWLDARATLRGCGALDAFFADESGWDLEEWIIRGIDRLTTSGKVTREDMAIFVMIREVGLSEAHVAARFDIEPAQAYQRAGRFQASLAQSPDLRKELDRCLELIANELLAD